MFRLWATSFFWCVNLFVLMAPLAEHRIYVAPMIFVLLTVVIFLLCVCVNWNMWYLWYSCLSTFVSTIRRVVHRYIKCRLTVKLAAFTRKIALVWRIVIGYYNRYMDDNSLTPLLHQMKSNRQSLATAVGIKIFLKKQIFAPTVPRLVTNNWKLIVI